MYICTYMCIYIMYHIYMNIYISYVYMNIYIYVWMYYYYILLCIIYVWMCYYHILLCVIIHYHIMCVSLTKRAWAPPALSTPPPRSLQAVKIHMTLALTNIFVASSIKSSLPPSLLPLCLFLSLPLPPFRVRAGGARSQRTLLQVIDTHTRRRSSEYGTNKTVKARF